MSGSQANPSLGFASLFDDPRQLSKCFNVEKIYVCKKCDKPKSKKVEGKAMKGKKLLQALQAEDLNFEVLPCKCLGKCKKGPNGLIMPGKIPLHRLSLDKLRNLSRR